MQRRGFTLIEVMVVLSILAIIAILAYNFFGNTMKEARLTADVTATYNAYQKHADCFHRMLNDGLAYPGSNTVMTSCVDNGYLRSLPRVPGTTYINGTEQDIRTFYINYAGPTGTQDRVLFTVGHTDDFCKAFNEKYTPHGNTIPDGSTGLLIGGLLETGGIACFVNGGNNYIEMTLEWN